MSDLVVDQEQSESGHDCFIKDTRPHYAQPGVDSSALLLIFTRYGTAQHSFDFSYYCRAAVIYPTAS